MMQQLVIADSMLSEWRLPEAYRPVAPVGFRVDQIVLCRGSLDTPERERFVRRICSVYPDTPVEEQLVTPHNRVELGETDPVRRVTRGKRTLVFGAMDPKHAVWDGAGKDENYLTRRRLSFYGFCFYDCRFCYLAGRSGVWFSPTVKIFVNLPEILAEVNRQASGAGGCIEFCAGELQDGLALDPLTAYSTVLIPFFARQANARIEVRTKSVAIGRLLGLEHGGCTALSWTLNPPEIANRYETNAPAVETRMEAMRQCAEAGYPVRASIMPVIPEGDWERCYLDFARNLLEHVRLEQLTLGGISMDERTGLLLERRVGGGNVISSNLSARCSGTSGKKHYPFTLCRDLFRQIAYMGHKMQPGLTVSVAIP